MFLTHLADWTVTGSYVIQTSYRAFLNWSGGESVMLFVVDSQWSNSEYYLYTLHKFLGNTNDNTKHWSIKHRHNINTTIR